MSTSTRTKRSAPLQGLAASMAEICPEFEAFIQPFNDEAAANREEMFKTRNDFEDLLASAGVTESALTDVPAMFRYGIDPQTVTSLQGAQAAAALAYRKASESNDELERQTRAFADSNFHLLGAAYIDQVTTFLNALEAVQPIFPAGNLISSLVPNGHRMTANNALVEIANLLPALISQARAQLNVSTSVMSAAVVA